MRALGLIATLLVTGCATTYVEPVKPAEFRWDQPVVEVWYNPHGAPQGLDTAKVEAIIADVAGQWSKACDITIKYMGQSDRVPGAIRWVPGYAEANTLGEGTITARDTSIIEFEVTLNAAKVTDHAKVHSTVLHEFGHVMGIQEHSHNERAVMYYAARGVRTLTKEDAARCKR
jgi:hypothetical protein